MTLLRSLGCCRSKTWWTASRIWACHAGLHLMCMFKNVCALEICHREVNKAWWRACPDGIALSKISTSTDVCDQGMTIRTARLPGTGNLLGQAGKDLSGLPDQASCHQFKKMKILTVPYFNSSTRFRVTGILVLRIHNRNISFLLHHQTDRLQCCSMWLACQCS